MGVNNVNNGSPVTWTRLNEPYSRGKQVQLSEIKDANLDNVTLLIPKTETIYRRKEFVTDERYAEGCATCYTYIQRTLTFDDGKGGTFTWGGLGVKDTIWTTNPKGDRTFAQSGVNMNDISHAVEETWEVRERSLQQSAFSISEVRAMTANGKTLGDAFGYTEQTMSYKYASASITEGTVKYKNGAVGSYSETALTKREIYNKCAVFIAEAFEEDSSELTLSDSAYNKLFGKIGGDEKTFSTNMAQRREYLTDRLNKLQELMEKNLSDIRKNYPDSKGLQSFEDTCLKLGQLDNRDITSLVLKLLAEENASGAGKHIDGQSV